MQTRIAPDFARKAISAGFILNGFALLGLGLVMVWLFGEALGTTWLEKRIYAGANVALHLFGTLCAIAIAMFVVDKSRAFAALAVMGVILVSGYGIVNMVCFAFNDRDGVAMVAEDNSKRVMTKYHEDRAYNEGRIKWLEGQSLDYDNAPKARKHYRTEAATAKAKLDAPEPPNVNPDGSTNVLSRITSLSSSDASQVLAISVGILIGEGLSFIFGVRLWPRKPEDEVAEQEGMAIEAKIAALPKPKGRALTVPEVVPADLPTKLPAAPIGMVPAAVLPADVPAQEAMPVDMPSKLRKAHPAEHIDVVLAALRNLGLTDKVSACASSVWPSFAFCTADLMTRMVSS